MSKIGILILADSETYGDLGRITNAFEITKEFSEAGDTVSIIFDGAATKWLGKVSDEQHYLNPLYKAVFPQIQGACKYCANAYGVSNQVQEAGVTMLDDYEDHPSIRNLVQAGYQIMTF